MQYVSEALAPIGIGMHHTSTAALVSVCEVDVMSMGSEAKWVVLKVEYCSAV